MCPASLASRLLKFVLLSSIVFVFFACALTNQMQAQERDLFDRKHTEQFTQYLTKTGQYDYAAQELERLLFLDPQNDSLKVQLLANYRLGRNLHTGLSRAEDFLKGGMPVLPVRKEYVKLLALNSQERKVYTFLALEGIEICEREQGAMQMASLLQDWKSMQHYDLASDCFSNRDREFYSDILYRGLHQKHKSPILAMGMSAIVPGSGKVYAREWKDGIMSFIFVASMAWQSYRGFKRKGTKSVYGWVFGGLATGFYCGNIYGSHKAARLYNDQQKEQLAKEIEAYVYGGF